MPLEEINVAVVSLRKQVQDAVFLPPYDLRIYEEVEMMISIFIIANQGRDRRPSKSCCKAKVFVQKEASYERNSETSRNRN